MSSVLRSVVLAAVLSVPLISTQASAETPSARNVADVLTSISGAATIILLRCDYDTAAENINMKLRAAAANQLGDMNALKSERAQIIWTASWNIFNDMDFDDIASAAGYWFNSSFCDDFRDLARNPDDLVNWFVDSGLRPLMMERLDDAIAAAAREIRGQK